MSNPLLEWRAKADARIANPTLDRLFIEFTRRCNMGCEHCGSPREDPGHGPELSAEEWKSLVFEQIAREFDMSNLGHVIFTGGEPLARLDDLLEVLEFTSKFPCYRNVVIQTNGLVLAEKPELFPKLRELGVTGFGFSLDGLGEAHDEFRGVRGSFEKVWEAAYISVRQDFMTTIGCVMNSGNISEMRTIYEFVRDRICAQIMRFIPLDVQGRTSSASPYLPSDKQIQKAIETVSSIHRDVCEAWERGGHPTVVELGCMDWLGEELEGRCQPKINCCIAGINTLGLMHDGLIGACSNIPREFAQGNVRSDLIKDVWMTRYEKFRNPEWKRAGECVGCDQWDYCRGGAMHRRSLDGSRTARCAYQVLRGLEFEGKEVK